MADEKAKRTRAFVRTYDFENLTATVKDNATNADLIGFDLSKLPEDIIRKLALSKAMDIIGGSMTEAHRDGEDAEKAGIEAVTELETGKVEFRDGAAGVAMGGTLKKVARALVELNLSFLKGPDGVSYTWSSAKASEPGFKYSGAEGIDGAFAALKLLWDVPEVKVPNGVVKTGKNVGKPAFKVTQESGRTLFNKIKGVPEIAAKLTAYNKKASDVVLG